jgi:hypothetical protein
VTDNCTDGLTKLEARIKELNDKFSQTLLFLSFALVVLATLRDKSTQGALNAVAWCWSLSLFPILLGILPLKELCYGNKSWYRFLQYLKAFLLLFAIIPILIGAYEFCAALRAGIFR